MDNSSSRSSFVLYLTMFTALVLQVFPLPLWAHQARPDFALLVLIYWSMALPNRIAIFAAVIVGVLSDALTASLLGQHVLAYAIAVYIVLILHKRLRLLPMWQQAITVLSLLYVERVIAALVLGITEGKLPNMQFWLPPVVGMLLWPWIFLLLRAIRQRYRIQ
ncbi:MAG: rod shape-determining protein MreD [Pseudomonadota bacterium]